jgi:hypothetical protein
MPMFDVRRRRSLTGRREDSALRGCVRYPVRVAETNNLRGRLP